MENHCDEKMARLEKRIAKLAEKITALEGDNKRLCLILAIHEIRLGRLENQDESK